MHSGPRTVSGGFCKYECATGHHDESSTGACSACLSSCSDGYNLVGVCTTTTHSRTCEVNICSCTNGNVAVNSAFTSNGANLCASCIGNYHLSNGSCVANTCSCTNGNAVANSAWTSNGANQCASCAAGTPTYTTSDFTGGTPSLSYTYSGGWSAAHARDNNAGTGAHSTGGSGATNPW
jgi:hypothetical protein